MNTMSSPMAKLWALVQEKKSDISAIYFFAILHGLVQLVIPVSIQAVIGFVLAATLSTSLVVLITVVVIAVILSGILQINQMKITERIQQRIFVKYAGAFAHHIPRIDLEKADAYYLPELVNRFFDTTLLQKSISKILLDLPGAVIQVLFGLILLSFYHPVFILFSMLLVLLVGLIIRLTGKQGIKSSLEKSKYKYQVAGWFEEMARLVKTFKYATASRLHLERADQKIISYLQARTSHFNILLMQYRSLVFFKVVITASMLIAGVVLLLDQQINVGQFVAAEIIIIAIINAVEKIIIDLDNVYDVFTAMEKLGQLTEKPAEPSGSYRLDPSLPIALEAKDLSFSYDGKTTVFNNISFLLEPGSKNCITVGSGKTTLLKLLTGIYRNYQGSLLINNVPMGNYHLESLRSQCGFIFPQENIFDGTLWENISMGRDDISQQYVSQLAKEVGLLPFIYTLDRGYDTHLDPTGRKLPRSVINKVLLVRALAHQPRLLIMEEPWMNIEDSYRKNIRQLLLSLPQTTVIVATNDAEFIDQCDHVINLK